MSNEATRDAVTESVEEQWPDLMTKFEDLLRIPSVGALPEHRHDLGRAAEMVRQWFEDAGLESTIHVAPLPGGGPGAPAVIATTQRNPELPTVLLYAHHDVQPAANQPGWSLDPFEPEIRPGGERGRIYGRGTADDKSAVVGILGSIRALQQVTGGDLPVNIVVLVEGEEEIGSPSMDALLGRYSDRLAADTVLIVDGNNWTPEIPMINSSLRGFLVGDITVEAFERGLHSGGFGGPLLDANILLARLLATLHGEEGEVAVEGLTTDLEIGEASARLEPETFRRDATMLEETELVGQDNLAETLWVKPSISLIGFDAPPTAAAPGTLWPTAKARISVRMPPNLPVEEAQAAVEKHLEANRPHGAKVSFTRHHGAQGYVGDMTSRQAGVLQDALAAAWQVDPVIAGSGGSVPLLQLFADQYPDAEILKVGPGDPLSRPHGEDESASLDILFNLTVAQALFMLGLGHQE